MINQLLFGDVNLKIDTEVCEKKFSFKWSVHNISQVPGAVENMRFSLVGDATKDWCATIKTKELGKFSVSLTCDSENPIPLRIEHTSKALDFQSLPLGGTSSSPLFFQERGDEGILLDDVKIPVAYRGIRQVIFECSMQMYGFDLDTTCEAISGQDAETADATEYQEGYRNMMNDPKYADLDIYCCGRLFPVHKCVIQFRARAFFEHHEEDIEKGKLEIKNIPSHIFRALLVWIYTAGEEPHLLAKEEYLELYAVASFYSLDGLVRKCAKTMTEAMTADSVFKVFSLAQKLKDEKLMMQCRVFMRFNLEELSTRAEWKNLLIRNPNHLEDVMKIHL